jgi:hypothetical protein
MKSFFESVQVTKNFKLARECFSLMAEQGLNPVQFVDWYIQEGMSLPNLQESSETWLKKQTLIVEFWGQTSDQIEDPELNSAEKALNLLHRRMGVSPELLQAVGGSQFMQTVLNLIQILRSKDMSKMAGGEPEQQEPEPFQNPNGYGYGESFVNDLKIKNEIRSNLKKLQSYGFSPHFMVEQYSEGMFDNAGEWLGNQWANVKGAFNRWGGGQSQSQPWGYDAQRRVAQKNSESITSAMTALQQLKSKFGPNIQQDFNEKIEDVLQGLQQAQYKMQQKQQVQAAQPEPQQVPVQQTTSEPSGASPVTPAATTNNYSVY